MKYFVTYLKLFIMVFPCLVYTKEISTIRLNLNEAENLGIQNSPEIRLISSQQRIKDLLVNENWRNYFPTATVRWDRNSSVIENSADSRNQRFTLNVEQVVFDGGRRSLALDAALADLALSKYDFKINLNQLKYKIRSSFFDILSSKAQYATLQKSLIRQKEQLYFAQKELELGEASQINVLELENRVNEIELQEKSSKIDLNTKIQEFKILLRVNTDLNLDIKGDLMKDTGFSHKPLEIDNLLGISKTQRVEYDKSKAEYLQAKSQYDYAQSFYVPTVSVGGFHGYRGEEYPPREREWGLNFRVSMLLGPNSVQDSSNYISRNQDTDRSLSSSTSLGIYDNLQYKREIVSTGINAYQTKLKLKQLDDIISTEVKKALANYKNSWEAMLQADSNIELFEKRIHIKETQVKLGEAPRTELAETEIRYLEAKNAQIKARLRYMSSIAELELSIGLSLDQLDLIKFNRDSK